MRFHCLNCKYRLKCKVRKTLGDLVVWCKNWKGDFIKILEEDDNVTLILKEKLVWD